MHVGIVAGEVSGDALGAGVMKAIQARLPTARFTGICGPQMLATGAEQRYSMDSISIMGLDGLLRNLGHIIKIRRELKREFLTQPPDVFVGIDVPDFNLGLEEQLRASGIPTVHYVSPTVWAWRSYRIRKIRRAVSHMLTLFPFEAEYYRRNGVPVTFVGHPVADQIPEYDQTLTARRELEIPNNGPVLALLPGSRTSEVRRLGKLFLNTASQLAKREPSMSFVVPFANRETLAEFEDLAKQMPQLSMHFVAGDSRKAIACSDLVLLASGTAALEAALLKKPMVVAYKVSVLTYAIVQWFSRVRYYSMPNNLLAEAIVPEFIQNDATVPNLVSALQVYLDNPDRMQYCREQFSTLHQQLRCDANRRAAETVLRIAGFSELARINV